MSRTRTLERLQRILVIVPWLLEHPGATFGEIAARFGGTPAELARDLDLLGYCGLPGYGGGDLIEVSIIGDSVTVRLAEFFRRPLRLSIREGLTLLLAAGALSAVPDLPASAGLDSAIVKLEAALGVRPGLAVDLAGPGDEYLALLREAVERRRVVALRYRSRSKGEVTDRDVEPWTLVGAHGAWYLQGWCRLAQGARDFRLDRVVAARMTEADAGPLPAEPSPPPRYRPEADDQIVVLLLQPELAWLPERLVVDAVEARGGALQVTLRTGSMEWLARLAVAHAPALQVVSPGALQDRVRDLARETLARYHTA